MPTAWFVSTSVSQTAAAASSVHIHARSKHRRRHTQSFPKRPARGRVVACCVGVCCVGACFTERRASSALGVKTVACAGGGTRTGTLGSTWGSQNCWVGASTVRFRPSLGSGPLTSPLTSQRGANTVIKATGVEPGVVMALNEMFGDGMTRDVGASLAAAVGAYLWVKMFDILASKNVLERKLSRKLIHTSCGPFFMLTWPLFSSSPEGVRLAAIGTGLVKNENAVRAVSREGDRKELLRGPLFYTAVMVVTTAVFWRTSPSAGCSSVGVAALSLMCGGDGLADIVGRRLGAGNKLWFNKNKSVAGSAAMFMGGFVLSMGLTSLFHYLGYIDLTVGEAAGRLAVVSAACTVVEALPITKFVDDNISVPVLAIILGGALFNV